MKTLIIGLGNPLLGDDGVGWRVAEGVQDKIGSCSPTVAPGTEVDFHAGGGLSLMERLVGYDRAIVIDAVQCGRGSPGSVYSLPLESLPDPGAGHLGSAHETNLCIALQVGRLIGAHLPGQVMVVAIESRQVYDFSESLTPQVARAVEPAVRLTLELLNKIDS